MTHQEFSIKLGNWLFVRRSWLPIFVYIVAILALFYDGDEVYLYQASWYIYLCLGVSLIGMVIRAATIGFVPKNTSGRNTSEGQVADTINTKGMYTVFRHPLYVGNFFMWLGLIMYVAVDWFVLVAVILYFIYYEKIILAEEAYMKSKFGVSYSKFCDNTNIIIPKFLWNSPDLDFSIINIIKREYYGLFYLILSFVLIDLFKNFFVLGQWHVSQLWIYIGLSVTISSLIVRIISKCTKWLEVDGR